jgi:hypothetical protein
MISNSTPSSAHALTSYSDSPSVISGRSFLDDATGILRLLDVNQDSRLLLNW